MKLFGTDGIRGLFNEEPLTKDTIEKIGSVLSNFKPELKFLIGKDTRQSCDFIEKHLIQGLSKGRCKVYTAGILPTPAVSALTKMLKIDYGIMITASHNPYEFNGIKIFDKNGEKISPVLEQFIERNVAKNCSLNKKNNPKVYSMKNAVNSYIGYINHLFKNLNLENVNLVVDCANGTTSVLVKNVFEQFNANVRVYNYRFNGKNINLKCGSLYPEKIKQFAKDGSIGFSYDGDGDRLIACDEESNIIDGDMITYVCAMWLKKHNVLNHNTIVTTILSNTGLEVALKKIGVKVIRTCVGDKNVYNIMKQFNYSFGSEPAGHILFKKFGPVSDAILTSLLLLKIMKYENKSLNELTKNVKLFPQVNLNVCVKEKKDLGSIKPLTKAIKEFNSLLKNKGRVLVRYSGTEPKLRIMVEYKSIRLAQSVAEKIKSIAESNLA